MVTERGALYYPYIHISDDNWLKATLLCFPYLERMVPAGYLLEEQSVSAFFAQPQVPGQLSLLRTRTPVGDPHAAKARMVLWDRLKSDVANPRLGLKRQFSKDSADQYPGLDDPEIVSEIHQHKVDADFFDWLKYEELIWPSHRRPEPDTQWWYIHPVLGQTLMSMYAVELAHGHDLDIVTKAPAIHTALLAADADDVYEYLIGMKPKEAARDGDEKVRDLMRFVIATDLDLTNIPPDEIVKLAAQKESISDLRARLSNLLTDVGDVPDREVWEGQLREKADQVVRSWYEEKKVFRSFLQTFAGRVLTGGREAAAETLKLVGPAGVAAWLSPPGRTGTSSTAFTGTRVSLHRPGPTSERRLRAAQQAPA